SLLPTQGHDRHRGDHDGPLAALRLEPIADMPSGVAALRGPVDASRACVKIHICPVEGEGFTNPYAGCQHEDEDRAEAVRARSLGEPACLFGGEHLGWVALVLWNA